MPRDYLKNVQRAMKHQKRKGCGPNKHGDNVFHGDLTLAGVLDLKKSGKNLNTDTFYNKKNWNKAGTSLSEPALQTMTPGTNNYHSEPFDNISIHVHSDNDDKLIERPPVPSRSTPNTEPNVSVPTFSRKVVTNPNPNRSQITTISLERDEALAAARHARKKTEAYRMRSEYAEDRACNFKNDYKSAMSEIATLKIDADNLRQSAGREIDNLQYELNDAVARTRKLEADIYANPCKKTLNGWTIENNNMKFTMFDENADNSKQDDNFRVVIADDNKN